MSLEQQSVYTIGTVARLAGASVIAVRLYKQEALPIPECGIPLPICKGFSKGEKGIRFTRSDKGAIWKS